MAVGSFGHLTLDDRRRLFRMHETRLSVNGAGGRQGARGTGTEKLAA